MAKKTKIKPIKAIVALCEGKTDVAFLRRLLEADNYHDYKEVVANIPKPLGLGGKKGESYFSKKLKSYDYDSSKLRDRPVLPLILKRVEGQSLSFILLYDMNGMNRVKNYREIIKDFQGLSLKSGNDEDYESSLFKMDIALAFIFDLDDKTKADRISYLRETYAESISELQYLSETKPIIDSKHFKGVGYHFFCEEAGQKGNLEDLILPMMKEGKEALFNKAEQFLNCEGAFIRKKESNLAEKDENKTESDFKKSLIGVVGQLETSGVNNADIIKITKYLDKDKFKRSTQCAAILKFIRNLRETLRETT